MKKTLFDTHYLQVYQERKKITIRINAEPGDLLIVQEPGEDPRVLDTLNHVTIVKVVKNPLE